MNAQILSEEDYTKHKEYVANELRKQNIEVARLFIEAMNPTMSKHEVMDKILERDKTAEELFMSEGCLSWETELKIGHANELTTVYVSLFNINIGLLSTMNEKHVQTFIGCYKRDIDQYVLFDTPIETNEGEEEINAYQKAMVKTMRVFNF